MSSRRYVSERVEALSALSYRQHRPSRADSWRTRSGPAVDGLHRLGKRVVMLTGDAGQVAEAVAAELGVDEVLAEVLPEDKAAAVAGLQRRGLVVAMVGDGVNDAPALAWAGVTLAQAVGAVLMSASTIVVALNAQLLRRLDLRPNQV